MIGDKIRPVANHRRKSMNKAHPIPHLQLSKKRLEAIQSYFHHIKPSIGVRFKILVGALYFAHQMVKLKGKLLWVKQSVTRGPFLMKRLSPNFSWIDLPVWDDIDKEEKLPPISTVNNKNLTPRYTLSLHWKLGIYKNLPTQKLYPWVIC